MPYGREIGEFAAEAEAHDANLSCAIRARPERGGDIAQIIGVLIRIHLRAQRLGFGAPFVNIPQITARFWRQ